MGRRKISLEPAARFRGAAGLSVMCVSLWGPHSFDASTFLPMANDGPGALLPPAPFCRSAWYLFHQVGLSGELVWAEMAEAIRHIAKGKCFIKLSYLRLGNAMVILPRGRRSSNQASNRKCLTG